MPPMQLDRTERIAFLGGGNMARALVGGLLRQGWPAERLAVTETRTAMREAFAHEFGVTVAGDPSVLADAAVVVLAVKPQDARSALSGLPPLRFAREALLLSIAAGLPIAEIARHAPRELAVVRAMPNRAALVGAGVTALYAPASIGALARERAEAIGHAVGKTVWLRSEPQLDVVTALSGSGPAYFFLLAEQLASAACELGLPLETATLLANETLYGAGQLARHAAAAGTTLADERVAVTSPGGTTAAALAVLAAGGFEQLIGSALRAAAARAAELSAPAGGA